MSRKRWQSMKVIPSQDIEKKNRQFNIEKCVFYKGKVVYTLYTNISILEDPDPKEICDILKLMPKAK